MKTALFQLRQDEWIKHEKSQPLNEEKAQLVLCFTARAVLEKKLLYGLLSTKFPNAHIVTCSTAGEIYQTEVLDESVTVTACEFEHTAVVPRAVHISDYEGSLEAGRALMQGLSKQGLVYVLVIADGKYVNGSALVQGMNEAAGPGILITGGLAGDGDRFEHTLVGFNHTAESGLITAVGFYGDRLVVGHGSRGGWETFGLERVVTRSAVNILYEIDNKNALELYKRYLGPDAESLPGAALLYPLAVMLPGAEEPVVRTILSVDDAAGSMTFAGDIPEGARVRFMRANFDKLTNAASGAAVQANLPDGLKPGFALLISCVGRKMVLQTRIEEEVEAVGKIFGESTLLSGFYSYGELSPLAHTDGCQLHNQTMTITTFHEME